jgi:hypothetical protein
MRMSEKLRCPHHYSQEMDEVYPHVHACPCGCVWQGGGGFLTGVFGLAKELARKLWMNRHHVPE